MCTKTCQLGRLLHVLLSWWFLIIQFATCFFLCIYREVCYHIRVPYRSELKYCKQFFWNIFQNIPYGSFFFKPNFCTSMKINEIYIAIYVMIVMDSSLTLSSFEKNIFQEWKSRNDWFWGDFNSWTLIEVSELCGKLSFVKDTLRVFSEQVGGHWHIYHMPTRYILIHFWNLKFP